MSKLFALALTASLVSPAFAASPRQRDSVARTRQQLARVNAQIAALKAKSKVQTQPLLLSPSLDMRPALHAMSVLWGLSAP